MPMAIHCVSKERGGESEAPLASPLTQQVSGCQLRIQCLNGPVGETPPPSHNLDPPPMLGSHCGIWWDIR